MEGGRLGGVDGDVLGHDVLALHAGFPREAADHDGDVHALGRGRRVGRCDHARQQGQGGVDQLHAHALQGLGRGLDVEEVEDDGLVGAEHGAPGDERAEGVPDLAWRERERRREGKKRGNG